MSSEMLMLMYLHLKAKEIFLNLFTLLDAIVKYDSFSIPTSSAWQGPDIIAILFEEIL